MTEPSPHVVPTQAGYDRWSAIYDREDNPVILLEQRHLGELLGSVDGCDVLDVGCGTGRHSIPLAQAGVRVTGLDFSEGMLARARAKAAACAGSVELRFLNHDLAQPLPVPDRSFDLVLCSLVLEHLRDLDAFLRSWPGRAGQARFRVHELESGCRITLAGSEPDRGSRLAAARPRSEPVMTV